MVYNISKNYLEPFMGDTRINAKSLINRISIRRLLNRCKIDLFLKRVVISVEKCPRHFTHCQKLSFYWFQKEIVAEEEKVCGFNIYLKKKFFFSSKYFTKMWYEKYFFEYKVLEVQKIRKIFYKLYWFWSFCESLNTS